MINTKRIDQRILTWLLQENKITFQYYPFSNWIGYVIVISNQEIVEQNTEAFDHVSIRTNMKMKKPWMKLLKLPCFNFCNTKRRLLGLETYSFFTPILFWASKTLRNEQISSSYKKNTQTFCLTPLGREVISTWIPWSIYGPWR